MTDATSAWDRFWQYDRIASFGTGPGAANYGAAISSGWKTFFDSLPDGARILDLATGNGAITLMAVAADKRFKVIGADLADVRPAAFVSRGKAQLKQIRFLARTPAEELPLETASVDAVVSQYGVEYSDLDRSLPEAARVLAPGGRLRFACHAADGSVAADTTRAIADADFLLDHVQLLDRASAGFDAILAVERGRAPGPLAQAAAQGRYATFRDALKAVAERTAKAADAAMLASVHTALTELFEQRLAHDAPAIEARIGELHGEVEAHRERQRALLAAALSAHEMHAMAATLSSLGLGDLKLGEQRDKTDLIGHVIEARRP